MAVASVSLPMHISAAVRFSRKLAHIYRIRLHKFIHNETRKQSLRHAFCTQGTYLLKATCDEQQFLANMRVTFLKILPMTEPSFYENLGLGNGYQHLTVIVGLHTKF